MVLSLDTVSGVSPHKDILTYFHNFWACFSHYVTFHTTLAAGPRKFEPSPQSNWFQRGPCQNTNTNLLLLFSLYVCIASKDSRQVFQYGSFEHKWTPLINHLNFIIPLPNNSWVSIFPPGILLAYFSQHTEKKKEIKALSPIPPQILTML